MVKEYYKFIKDYLNLSHTKKSYFWGLMLTSIAYKVFMILAILFSSHIIKYITINDITMTYISLGLFVIASLGYRFTHFANNKIFGKNMRYSYSLLQKELLNKIINSDDSFTKKVSKGKLLNAINVDVINVGLTCNKISDLITSLIQIIIMCIIVGTHNILLSLMFIIYSVIYIVIRNYADKKATIYLTKQKQEVDNYSSLFSQMLSGLGEIKTFNMLPKLRIKLSKIRKKISKNYYKKMKYIIMRDNDYVFVQDIIKAIIYTILIVLMMKGNITIDILVLVIGYYDTISTYLRSLITSSTGIREANVSVVRINEILNYNSLENIDFGNITEDDINGIVTFNNVCFGYDKKEILKNINFNIKPHSITAIVGQSGAGKSTIFNLLLRFYKPSSGNILIDNVDIYDYTKEIYKSNVSVVNQKPFIFNMSIRKNLDFVDKNIENQINACKRVGIHDFIETLPHGYDTELREDAFNISGGQKQLISLARTLLSKAEILLFDEITSSLDVDTASNIDEILKDLKKDHTIIMITHKPELMKKADRIIVLNNGQIVGDGKHKDLLNNKYYSNLQSRKSASKIGVFDNE